MGLLGGIIGGVSSLLGGNSQKKAAKVAANAQIQAAQLGVDEQRRQFDLSRSDFAPYLGAGTEALGDISDILGLNGAGPQSSAISLIENSPIFSALARQGEDAILQNASATGGVRGGNTQGILAQFRPQLLDSLIQRQLSSLGGLANMGQGSAGQIGQLGSATASNIGNLLGQQGAATAGSALTRGGINASTFANLGDSLSSILSGLRLGGGFKGTGQSLASLDAGQIFI